MAQTEQPGATFDAFFAAEGGRLRRALVARYGVDDGVDVCADALAYAWQHWDRIRVMDNPSGYLFRVAQTASRRHRRWGRGRTADFPMESVPTPAGGRWTEDDHLDLGLALAGLAAAPRTCVVLVHVYGCSYADVADVLDTTTAAVRAHLHRGMTRLRELMEN